MPIALQSKALRFGPFELDLRSEELCRSGFKTRLQGQSFQILVLLLEHAGEVVTREELQHRLWPGGTFVDFERGLNNAVKRLRETLGDSADSPAFIETLPRKGYRFIAPLLRVERELDEPASPLSGVASNSQSGSGPSEVHKGDLSAQRATDLKSADLPRHATRRTVLLGIGSVALCAGGAWIVDITRKPALDSPMILEVSLPAGIAAGDPGRLLGPPVVSPDGASIVIALTTSRGSSLFIRPLNSERLVEMRGTTGAVYPFWSPDSQHIGFFTDSKLKRMPAGGGSTTVLCGVARPRGAAWSIHGTILFGLNNQALFRVPDSGGVPEKVTDLDQALGENSHRSPSFLPDGSRFLYFARMDDREKDGIYLSSLAEPHKRRRIGAADGAFVLAANNAGRSYLITQQAGKFIDQEFDLRSGELIRKSHQLLDQAGSLSVSNNGVLVFRNDVDLKNRLVWRDRSGTQIGIQGEPANDWAIQLSPDKRSIAEVRHDALNGQFQLWAGPVAGGPSELISRLDHVIQVAWSSDGKALFYFDYRRNILARRDVNPLAPEVVVLAPTSFRPSSVFQGDRYVGGEFAPDNTHATAAWLAYSASGLGTPHFFEANGASGLHPAFSPNGKWIAFGSEETGTPEVYIMDFPAGRVRKRISSAGGKEVRWRGDSSELYYLGPDGSVMAVKVKGALEEIVSTPEILFRGNVVRGSDGPVYDVSSDGERFLLVEQSSTDTSNSIKIIVNWSSLLER